MHIFKVSLVTLDVCYIAYRACCTPQQVDPNAKFSHTNQYLPSEVLLEDSLTLEAVTVLSAEGEQVKLAERVPLVDGVEQWLKHLHHSIHRSLNHLLHKLMKDVLGGMPPEEWPNKVSLSLLLMFELENSKNVFWFVDSRKLLHYIVSKTHECLLRYEYCACARTVYTCLDYCSTPLSCVAWHCCTYGRESVSRASTTLSMTARLSRRRLKGSLRV